MKTIAKYTCIILLFVFSCDKKEKVNPGNAEPPELFKPTVVTQGVYCVASTNVYCKGQVVASGSDTILTRGIYFGLDTTTSQGTVLEGSGVGKFECILSMLQPNTTYYYRAYAKNSVGTSVGKVKSVTTKSSAINYEGLGVEDIDGNKYPTVVIGAQEWMAENLQTTRYQNGDAIPATATLLQDIESESAPKYQWIYNGVDSNLVNCGRLYTWYAATDSRNVCPVGWHTSSQAEWITLINYLSSNSYGNGNQVKPLSSVELWRESSNDNNTGGIRDINNESGFNARPAGARFFYEGTRFGRINHEVFFWLSTSANTTRGYSYYWSYDSAQPYSGGYEKTQGASIRCIKD